MVLHVTGFSCKFLKHLHTNKILYIHTHRGGDESSPLTKLYVGRDKAVVMLLGYGELGNKSERVVSGVEGLHRKQFFNTYSVFH